MKAKELLKALNKDGMLEGDLIQGEKIKSWDIVEGKIFSKKEYYCTFHEVVYIKSDVIMKTPLNEKVYLYQI